MSIGILFITNKF